MAVQAQQQDLPRGLWSLDASLSVQSLLHGTPLGGEPVLLPLRLELHGDGVNAKTTKGELHQWWGYALALTLNPGVPIEKAWSAVPIPNSSVPPLNMGVHGMGIAIGTLALYVAAGGTAPGGS